MKKIIFTIVVAVFSTVTFANELDLFFQDIPLNSKIAKIECYTDGISSQVLRLDSFRISKDESDNWAIFMTVDEVSVKKTIQDQSDYEISFSTNEKRIDLFGRGPAVSLVFNGAFTTLITIEYIPRWNQADSKRECSYFGNKL